jgi:hypothetical protein
MPVDVEQLAAEVESLVQQREAMKARHRAELGPLQRTIELQKKRLGYYRDRAPIPLPAPVEPHATDCLCGGCESERALWALTQDLWNDVARATAPQTHV